MEVEKTKEEDEGRKEVWFETYEGRKEMWFWNVRRKMKWKEWKMERRIRNFCTINQNKNSSIGIS